LSQNINRKSKIINRKLIGAVQVLTAQIMVGVSMQCVV